MLKSTTSSTQSEQMAGFFRDQWSFDFCIRCHVLNCMKKLKNIERNCLKQGTFNSCWLLKTIGKAKTPHIWVSFESNEDQENLRLELSYSHPLWSRSPAFLNELWRVTGNGFTLLTSRHRQHFPNRKFVGEQSMAFIITLWIPVGWKRGKACHQQTGKCTG